MARGLRVSDYPVYSDEKPGPPPRTRGISRNDNGRAGNAYTSALRYGYRRAAVRFTSELLLST